MKFFQKPAAALLLAILIVPSSLLLNTKVKLTDECRELEESFYTAENGGKSSGYYVNSRISDAASLATVGSHYPELAGVTEALREARSTLAAAYEGRDIYAMYRANAELTRAVAAFEQAAQSVVFTEMDQVNYDDRVTALAGAQRNLDNSTYNEEVSRFRRTVYDRFPASVLAAIVGVDAPPLFE